MIKFILVFVLCLLAGTVLAFNSSLSMRMGNKMTPLSGSTTPADVVFQTAATTWQGGAVTW